MTILFKNAAIGHTSPSYEYVPYGSAVINVGDRLIFRYDDEHRSG